MFAVVALKNRRYSYLQLLLLWGVSGRMDIPGVNPPDMPRTPMLSGE